MTRPPLTPREIVEALCEAQHRVSVDMCFGNGSSTDGPRRDAIKARLVEWMEAKPGEASIVAWRKLEGVARGE